MNREWTSNVTTANKSVTFNFLKHSSRDTHGYMTQIIITQNTNRLWRSQTPNKISWSQKLRIGCIQLTVLESDAQLKTLAANQHRNKRTRIKRNGFFSQHNHKKYANCYNLPHLLYTTDKHSFTHWYNTNTTNHVQMHLCWGQEQDQETFTCQTSSTLQAATVGAFNDISRPVCSQPTQTTRRRL